MVESFVRKKDCDELLFLVSLKLGQYFCTM